jgi:hypothetical protein
MVPEGSKDQIMRKPVDIKRFTNTLENNKLNKN